MRPTREEAERLDREDPLAGFREQFVIDEPDLIYLDGNSLGRLPRRTAARVREVVEQEWGRRLIRGWNEGWFTAGQRIGASRLSSPFVRWCCYRPRVTSGSARTPCWRRPSCERPRAS